jgi:hypothetical protein
MGLKTSKHGQSYGRDEMDEDEELNKMSFNRPNTAQQFEMREIDDEGGYQMSRKQRSFQTGRKMDRIRPKRNAREEGGQV